jgi:hypothetical protein
VWRAYSKGDREGKEIYEEPDQTVDNVKIEENTKRKMGNV